MRIATACTCSCVHMKLMLFTDFMQTHQSNLRPSDWFPPLDSIKNTIWGGGDANTSNIHRVRGGLRNLTEPHIIRYLPEFPAVSPTWTKELNEDEHRWFGAVFAVDQMGRANRHGLPQYRRQLVIAQSVML